MTTAEILIRAGVTREQLGEQVRKRWVEWALRQPRPKPSHLVPFAGLSLADQEADMMIGEDLFTAGWRAALAAQDHPRPCHCLCAVAHPHAEGVCDALNATEQRHVQLRTLALVIQLCKPCAAEADADRREVASDR